MKRSSIDIDRLRAVFNSPGLYSVDDDLWREYRVVMDALQKLYTRVDEDAALLIRAGVSHARLRVVERPLELSLQVDEVTVQRYTVDITFADPHGDDDDGCP